jgi:DNA-binding transcriptional MerR regulator/methylmalonyl-CoA mutase cobalamin-binding subunit
MHIICPYFEYKTLTFIGLHDSMPMTPKSDKWTMTLPNNTPTYNLKAVVKETGIKPDTLRAWERRYGLPEPQRTQGGHRIYSQHDIDILKWLLERQREGLSISRAVDLWNSLVDEGSNPLMTAPYIHEEAAIAIEPGKAIDDLRHAWVQACLDFDERRAEAILNQAFAVYPPEAVSQHLIQLGVAEIGKGWFRGQVTVQQEHFATELGLRRLEAQVAAAPTPNRADRILVACPPGEEHSFSTLLITFLLRRVGWDVIYLGANVPLSELDSTIESARPKLVIVVAQSLPAAASLAEMSNYLSDLGALVAFGGGIFVRNPKLTKHVAGHYLGDDLGQIHARVEQVLSSSEEPGITPTISDASMQMLDQFWSQRSRIDFALQQNPDLQAIDKNHLAIANRHMALNIKAALYFGNLALLQDDLTWVQGLLSNTSLPLQLLSRYLQIYADALVTTLDDAGQVIAEALSTIELKS